MNSPFSVSQGDAADKEHMFVTQALSTMVNGRILFSLLPLGSLFGAHDEKVWRRDELLTNHTLLSVVTFPEDLFYPTALKQVAGIVVKKGVPHPREQDVFWARIMRDGHIKSKSKRLLASEFDPPREERNELSVVLPHLRSFISHPGMVSVSCPQFYKTAPIDFSDPLLELLPEAYIDNQEPTSEEIQKAIDDLARETAAFLIRFRRESSSIAFDGNDAND